MIHSSKYEIFLIFFILDHTIYLWHLRDIDRSQTIVKMASEETGLTHACGVFACIRADGVSSAEVDVASIISLGLVSLQHR